MEYVCIVIVFIFILAGMVYMARRDRDWDILEENKRKNRESFDSIQKACQEFLFNPPKTQKARSSKRFQIFFEDIPILKFNIYWYGEILKRKLKLKKRFNQKDGKANCVISARICAKIQRIRKYFKKDGEKTKRCFG